MNPLQLLQCRECRSNSPGGLNDAPRLVRDLGLQSVDQSHCFLILQMVGVPSPMSLSYDDNEVAAGAVVGGARDDDFLSRGYDYLERK